LNIAKMGQPVFIACARAGAGERESEAKRAQHAAMLSLSPFSKQHTDPIHIHSNNKRFNTHQT
jgi:hypothetical protein